jgi:hypothetical protein
MAEVSDIIVAEMERFPGDDPKSSLCLAGDTLILREADGHVLDPKADAKLIRLCLAKARDFAMKHLQLGMETLAACKAIEVHLALRPQEIGHLSPIRDEDVHWPV